MSAWTQEEFKAYLLIYASQSDHSVTVEEQELLEERIGSSIFKKINKEIKSDNDYQRLQKVMGYIEENDYSQSELDALLAEMKEVFVSDGDFDVIEQATLRFMSKILKA